jgi:hypothetical protein
MLYKNIVVLHRRKRNTMTMLQFDLNMLDRAI